MREADSVGYGEEGGKKHHKENQQCPALERVSAYLRAS